MVLGQKGHDAIKALGEKTLRLINEVLIGTDKNVQDDFSKKTSELCSSRNISWKIRQKDQTYPQPIIIAIGWRWMINVEADQKLFVFHDSLLPRYRGFSPLVSALINGEKEIGVTCLIGEKEFDQGDIILQKRKAISYPIKINTAIEVVAGLYGEILQSLLQDIADNKELQQTPQDHANASYSVWRDEEDYYIDWHLPADRIARMIDAVGFPYLGARARVNEQEFIINEAQVLHGYRVENQGVGKVLFKKNNTPVVICGSDLLWLKSISNLAGEAVDFPSQFRIRFK